VLQKVPRYRDRQQAGGVLGELLVKYAGQNVAVFGVGPGGVVVAAPVAAALGADLDVLMIRPLTMPGRPDRAWGALSASDERVYVVAEQDAEAAAIASADVPGSASRRELTALRHLRDTMRSGRLPERSVDGWSSWWVTAWASVAAMRAAASAVRGNQPARLVHAVPAATGQTCRELAKDADELVCPWSLGPFRAVAPVYSVSAEIGVADVRRALTAV